MSSTALSSGTPLADALARTRQTRALVEELIAQPALLGPDFAVIRRIDDPTVLLTSAQRLGWKATGRGRTGTPIGDTLTLLEEAKRLGLVERLDWAFRCLAFDVATTAGMAGELHLTPEPETFGSACPPRLAVSFLRGRRALAVVAELHADAFRDERLLRTAVEQMRSWGWQFAYGDVSGSGAERHAVELLDVVRPAYQHVDLALAGSPALYQAATAAGATLLAVHVDRPADLSRARDLGAVWARGDAVGLAVPTPA